MVPERPQAVTRPEDAVAVVAELGLKTTPGLRAPSLRRRSAGVALQPCPLSEGDAG